MPTLQRKSFPHLDGKAERNLLVQLAVPSSVHGAYQGVIRHWRSLDRQSPAQLHLRTRMLKGFLP